MRSLYRRALLLVAALALLLGGLAAGALPQPSAGSVAAAATCTSSVGPGIAPPALGRGGIAGFHAKWFGQSGYMRLCPGAQSTATVAYQNNGSFGWFQGSMGHAAYLGTWGAGTGQDQASALGGLATGWPNPNRLAAQPTAYVGPNQIGWFQFTLQAPSEPGVYTLALRPLIEGAQWMEDYGVYWVVTVLKPDGALPPAPPAVVPGAVAAPRPPAAYSVPAGALAVSTSAGLISALQGSTPRDIVLADGTYDNAGPFVNTNGHHVYAARLLGARFTAGFNMAANSGNDGGLLRGLAFDVSAAAKTFQGAVVFTWGGPKGIRVLDSTFNGHKALATAITARQPDGLVVQRVVIRDFVDWGISADNNIYGSVLQTPLLLEDIDVDGVTHAVPLSGSGMSEACLGVGNTAVVRRVKVRNCAWMGISPFTSSHGSLFEDLDIDLADTGLYLEHFSSGSTFQRMRIGPSVNNGITSEGTDPADLSRWNGVSTSIDDVIQDSTIDSRQVGVLMGWATTRQTVRRVTFRGQYVAAITDYKGINNTYYENNYSGIQAGARAVSPVWWR